MSISRTFNAGLPTQVVFNSLLIEVKDELKHWGSGISIYLAVAVLAQVVRMHYKSVSAYPPIA